MTSKEIVPKKLFPEFFQAFKWAEKSQNNFSYLKQKSILNHIKINLATLIFGPKNGEYYTTDLPAGRQGSRRKRFLKGSV